MEKNRLSAYSVMAATPPNCTPTPTTCNQTPHPNTAYFMSRQFGPAFISTNGRYGGAYTFSIAGRTSLRRAVHLRVWASKRSSSWDLEDHFPLKPPSAIWRSMAIMAIFDQVRRGACSGV